MIAAFARYLGFIFQLGETGDHTQASVVCSCHVTHTSGSEFILLFSVI